MVMALRASLVVEARPHRHACAEGQVLMGVWVVGAEAGLYALSRVSQGPTFPDSAAPAWTGRRESARDDAAAFFFEQIGDEVALGAVTEHQIQIELLGDADGGEDVVGPVGVEKTPSVPSEAPAAGPRT